MSTGIQITWNTLLRRAVLANPALRPDLPDVRQVAALRRLCPTAFPPRMRAGALIAHCDGRSGAWMVTRAARGIEGRAP